MTHSDPVREFIRAFNERDLDAFAAVLDPEVELHSMRGLRKGREAARLWATRPPGGVQQTIELEELYEGLAGPADGVAVALIRRKWHWEEDGTHGPADGVAVALIRRKWHWEEDGTHAGEEEMAWSFRLHNGLVRSWRPFEDREEALRSAGLRG